MYFDEYYHVFTAREMMRGNPASWRLPGAILGTLTVYMVFLIAKRLFKDEKVGLLSAGGTRQQIRYGYRDQPVTVRYRLRGKLHRIRPLLRLRRLNLR